MLAISVRFVGGLLAAMMLVSACAPAAQPTPTQAVPTSAPTAAPKALPAASPTAAPKAAPPASPTAASKAQAAPPKAPTKVRLGTVGFLSDAGFFIAVEKGYFKDQGLDVEITQFDTAAAMVPSLATGQIDVGGGAPSASLFNAVARDIRVKIVADKGSMPLDESYQGLMIRQDLYDAGRFKDYADLKGMKIAIFITGVTGHVALDRALQKGGLTLNDVEVVVMPAGQQPAALASGAIDATVQVEPLITQLQEQKIAKLVKSINDFYPNQQQAVVFYSPNFIKDKPDAARSFIVAYLKGVRYYNDAFAKKNKQALDEVVDILVKHTTVKNKALYGKMGMAGLNPNGEVFVKSLEDDQEWYLSHGLQEARADINALVDQSFVKYAVQQLGPYK
ncbi:MAG: ABC transporter substrate-binding protein [Chloroflexi bacterium]|nr:ABC transporter substrate-binding protein [Chloroflexota bacterium]